MDLHGVKSWFYQLQGLPNAEDRHEDLLVIDIDEDPDNYLTKPDGTPRIVAAYLSIGEAEDYRAYWHKLHERTAKDPVVLGENPDWTGNYTVKFWKPDWQHVITDRIREAQRKGFNALYLDKVDAFEDIETRWPKWADMLDLKLAMVHFLQKIRATADGMAIIMQNAEGLTDYPAAMASIDGIGKEDLFYGQEDTGKANDRAAVRWSLDQLQKSGKPVFAIEYLDNNEDKRVALQMLQRVGYVPFFDEEDRALDGA